MRKRIFVYTAAILLPAIILVSCTKEEGKLPVQNTPPPPPGACDTVTWSKHIQPLVKKNCSTTPGCHTGAAPQGNVNLDTYEQVKGKAETGRIKARVFDKIPAPMPPSPSTLTPAELNLLQCWLDNGQKQ